MLADSDLPIKRGFFNEYVHGSEKQIGAGSQSVQWLSHYSLHQAALTQRLQHVTQLTRQTKRHQFRDRQKLKSTVSHAIYLKKLIRSGHRLSLKYATVLASNGEQAIARVGRQ